MIPQTAIEYNNWNIMYNVQSNIHNISFAYADSYEIIIDHWKNLVQNNRQFIENDMHSKHK